MLKDRGHKGSWKGGGSNNHARTKKKSYGNIHSINDRGIHEIQGYVQHFQRRLDYTRNRIQDILLSKGEIALYVICSYRCSPYTGQFS